MNKVLLTSIVFVSLFATTAKAWSDNIIFNFVSDYPYTVQVKFYSQTYNRVWPGSYTAWDINDWDTHTYNLECRTGEKIAWGAWSKGNPNIYWGSGDGNQGCSGCVYTCGGGTPPTQRLK